MTILENRLARAALGVVTIVLPAWYFILPTFTGLGEHAGPYIQETVSSGRIQWRDSSSAAAAPASIPLIKEFFGTKWLDKPFRDAAIVFSPSNLKGYDEVAWWQVWMFLMDLSGVYVVWVLEGTKRWGVTGGFLACVWLFVAQLVTIGLAGPLWYFLLFTFGRSAGGLGRKEKGNGVPKVEKKANGDGSMLLPIILGLHIGMVTLAYFSPDQSARHWWIWAWQPVPLWIGILNSGLSITVLRLPGAKRLRDHWLFSAETLSLVVGAVSVVSWVSVWLKAPYSIKEIFIPATPLGQQTEFALVCRELLQLDYLVSFWAAFAWLGCTFLDMYAARTITGVEFATAIVSIPVQCLMGGSGFALLSGWWWKERQLLKVKNNVLKEKSAKSH